MAGVALEDSGEQRSSLWVPDGLYVQTMWLVIIFYKLTEVVHNRLGFRRVILAIRKRRSFGWWECSVVALESVVNESVSYKEK